MGVWVGMGVWVRDSAAPVLAGQSALQSTAGHQVTLGMPALCKAASPRNKGTRLVPLKCLTFHRYVVQPTAVQPFESVGFSGCGRSESQAARRASREWGLHKLPRAAFWGCF